MHPADQSACLALDVQLAHAGQYGGRGGVAGDGYAPHVGGAIRAADVLIFNLGRGDEGGDDAHQEGVAGGIDIPTALVLVGGEAHEHRPGGAAGRAVVVLGEGHAGAAVEAAAQRDGPGGGVAAEYYIGTGGSLVKLGVGDVAAPVGHVAEGAGRVGGHPQHGLPLQHRRLCIGHAVDDVIVAVGGREGHVQHAEQLHQVIVRPLRYPCVVPQPDVGPEAHAVGAHQHLVADVGERHVQAGDHFAAGGRVSRHGGEDVSGVGRPVHPVGGGHVQVAEVGPHLPVGGYHYLHDVRRVPGVHLLVVAGVPPAEPSVRGLHHVPLAVIGHVPHRGEQGVARRRYRYGAQVGAGQELEISLLGDRHLEPFHYACGRSGFGVVHDAGRRQ